MEKNNESNLDTLTDPVRRYKGLRSQVERLYCSCWQGFDSVGLHVWLLWEDKRSYPQHKRESVSMSSDRHAADHHQLNESFLSLFWPWQYLIGDFPVLIFTHKIFGLALSPCPAEEWEWGNNLVDTWKSAEVTPWQGLLRKSPKQ